MSFFNFFFFKAANFFFFFLIQRLQQLGPQDDWEQVRVPRLKGESENVW